METHTLLSAVTTTGAGSPLALNPKKLINGAVPIQVAGITNATVVIQATISTQAEIDAGTAVWDNILGGSFTADTCVALFAAFPYIRANCTAYVGGTITVKVQA